MQLILCFPVTGVLSKHIDHRNLFTQRVCCKRQSNFVYIGQGKTQHMHGIHFFSLLHVVIFTQNMLVCMCFIKNEFIISSH